MSSNPPGPSRWERLRHTTQIKTAIFELLSVRFRHAARRAERDFTVIDAPDWVNIVAVTPDDQLVLVRQFRYGINEFSLEIPGGVIERGEEPVAAGVRELREETGYVGTNATLLGSVHPNPAIQSNRSHFVLVENAVKSAELAWDADEEIHVTTEPFEEVLALVDRGAIVHGLVLNALMFYERRRRR
ncbi:MAG: NUDIX hydrolase [Opitutaceae bacterium]|nr:NUDIX hydrolase [Opitutaceae bacterium]